MPEFLSLMADPGPAPVVVTPVTEVTRTENGSVVTGYSPSGAIPVTALQGVRAKIGGPSQ